MSYPLPKNEAQRLQVLHDLQILDSLPQKIFDNITSLAASICGVPSALISLVDDERVWFKARLGYEGTESRRTESLCAHAIVGSEQVFVVNDAATDVRFAAYPSVKSGQMRFYAGAPMTTSCGHALGVVCVLDHQPRELTPSQASQLQRLADLAMSLIENEAHRKRESGQVLNLVRKNEQIIRSVLDEGPEMCAFIDARHRFQFVNAAHEHYWNAPRESLLGMHVQELVGSRLYAEVFREGIRSALSGEDVHFGLSHDFPGVGLRHMEVRHIPARDDEGLVYGVVERFLDVTELTEQALSLKNHVAELGSQRLAQRKYLHVISHDLKEPINAINNAAPLLSASLQNTLAPIESQCLTYITQGGRRMAQLLEDLRLFSEMETEGLQVTSHPAEALLGRVLTHVNREVSGRPLRIDIAAPGTLQVNAGVFELAVRYLIETVIQSSPSDHLCLHLQLTHPADEACLQVTDCTAESDFVLTEPSPLDLSEAGVGVGQETPLALSIAEHIVKAHRGTLREEMTVEGSRCYTITLPHSGFDALRGLA